MDSKNHFDDTQGAETRRRLLDAAGQMFAEQGLKNATTRDIVAKAGANIAAVNYHFGGKEGLYAAALDHWWAEAMRKYPPGLGINRNDRPEEQLAGFIHAFVMRVLDPGKPSWHGKLMMREMVEPTGYFDQQIERAIKPVLGQLRTIISAMLPGADAVTIRRAMLSVVGQCVFYHHGRPVLERVFPEQTYDAAEAERIANHIASFSIAALKALGRQQRRRTGSSGRAGR